MIENTTRLIRNAEPFGIETGFPPAARSEALGKNAKSVDKSLQHNRICINGDLDTHVSEARSARWNLKRAVEKLLPNSRTARCCKGRLPIHRGSSGTWERGSSDVRIYQSLENGSTFYGGLETCSSVWCCPLCAAKISERRRHDLSGIRDAWIARGGIFKFLTLTFPHGSYDKLADLLAKFSKARKSLFSSRPWREWAKSINLIHKIYALEVTHGIENGWHIHLHCVLLILPTSDAEEPYPSDILKAWQCACVSSGLGRPNSHGVDIRNGESATDYITKWGLDLELTKQHVKHGRAGHSTPFDLLRAYAEGDSLAGLLFQEFAREFRGKRQIILSRGLRKDLGIAPEKTDCELAQEDLDKAICIATLTTQEWCLVLKHDLRFALLEEGRLRGSDGVQQFLMILSTA
jgi:hypothetical protein